MVPKVTGSPREASERGVTFLIQTRHSVGLVGTGRRVLRGCCILWQHCRDAREAMRKMCSNVEMVEAERTRAAGDATEHRRAHLDDRRVVVVDLSHDLSSLPVFAATARWMSTDFPRVPGPAAALAMLRTANDALHDHQRVRHSRFRAVAMPLRVPARDENSNTAGSNYL